MSAEMKEVALLLAKLRKARDAMNLVGKNVSANGYMAAGIVDYVRMVEGPLSENGLYLVAKVAETGREQLPVRDKTAICVHTMCDLTVFDVDTGASLTVTAPGEGIDFSDKASGKANSYARKNAIQNLFNLGASSDDNEADSSTHDIRQAVKKAPPSKPSPVTKALDALKELGFEREAILKELKVEKLKDIQPSHLPKLRDMYRDAKATMNSDFPDYILVAIDRLVTSEGVDRAGAIQKLEDFLGMPLMDADTEDISRANEHYGVSE